LSRGWVMVAVLVVFNAGDAGPITIDKIRFYPRIGLTTRANGTVFRGSNDDCATWTDIHTIGGVSAAQWYETRLPERASFRRIRVCDGHDGLLPLAAVRRPRPHPAEARPGRRSPRSSTPCPSVPATAPPPPCVCVLFVPLACSVTHVAKARRAEEVDAAGGPPMIRA
jgi:hypothetical protein